MSVSESAITERLALLATIDPVSAAAGTSATDVIDLMYWERVVFTIALGVMQTGSTVDFAIQSDTASNGAFATTVKSITQLTKAGSDDAKQVRIEVRAAEVGKRYIRGLLTVGTDASLVCVIAEGEGKYEPVSSFDLASVDEIKNS